MITAKTKITGLLGYPVEHSLSPLMHNKGFKHLEIDYCYAAFPVHPDYLSDALKGLRALNFSGVNVTIPHKENVLSYLDEIDDEARFIGAVNTILNKDGILKGFNTDGRGFIRSLSEAGIELAGKKIFILGAGGACRAVSYYLSKKDGTVKIFDVDKGKRDILVNDLKKINPHVHSENELTEIKNCDIIINATPLGLNPNDPLPFKTSMLDSEKVICDLIYWDTQLIKKARSIGCTVINGLGMLFWQGVLAFEIWTGKEAPVEIMRKALNEGMQKKKA